MNTPTASPVQTRVSALPNYIDGAWCDASGVDTLQDRNPANGEVIARVPLSGAAEVRAAAQAARAAFPAWRATSVVVRARAVFALRDKLYAHKEELAQLVTRDMGKTLDDARGEVQRGIESVEAACAIPHLLKGESLEGVARDLDVDLVRQPVGVVAAITPFNFPAMIPLWFLPYAIACGNTFILKPSEQDPLTSQRMLELIDEIEEIPAGVVNLGHGGRDAVNALLDDPDVDAVSFVGSASTAHYIYRRAAENGKRVQALGGARNSMVVMPDADPELMVKGVNASAFGAGGQRCLAGSVAVLVGTPGEQDATRDRIVEAARDLRTGDGADPRTDVCPLVSVEARERIEDRLAEAEQDGIEFVLDGRIGGGEGGAELGPTIVDGVPADHHMAQEELFGPVLSLVRVPDLESALAQVNSSRYGNATAIFTSSGHAEREYRYHVEVGMIGVNVGVPAPIAWFPFSGWKESFDGDLHANGTDAIDLYTRKKVVTTRWR